MGREAVVRTGKMGEQKGRGVMELAEIRESLKQLTCWPQLRRLGVGRIGRMKKNQAGPRLHSCGQAGTHSGSEARLRNPSRRGQAQNLAAELQTSTSEWTDSQRGFL